VRDAYLEAFTAALHPVYLSAAGIGAFAFAIAWLLEEAPLKSEPRAETIGESFAAPRDPSSLDELTLIVDRLADRDNRWATLARLAERAGVDLAPDAMWLLAHICLADGPLAADMLAGRHQLAIDRVNAIADQLATQGLALRLPAETLIATEAGRATYERLADQYRARLSRYVERWSPEERDEVSERLSLLSRALIAEPPIAP
jgi:DNA-binding MarR family transcriptional regulator